MLNRSKEQLEQWIAEYEGVTPELASAIEVLCLEDAAERGTGLVVLRLQHLAVDVYLNPAESGSPFWEVTFGARERELSFDSRNLRALAVELDTAAGLCEFLQQKAFAEKAVDNAA